jgi:hypothetical protein
MTVNLTVPDLIILINICPSVQILEILIMHVTHLPANQLTKLISLPMRKADNPTAICEPIF